MGRTVPHAALGGYVYGTQCRCCIRGPRYGGACTKAVGTVCEGGREQRVCHAAAVHPCVSAVCAGCTSYEQGARYSGAVTPRTHNPST